MAQLLLLFLAACEADHADKDGTITDFKVDFKLLNDKGEATSVFKYGEDIIFDLTITNQSNSSVEVSTYRDAVTNENTFRVYTQNGQDMGRPWDEIWAEFNLLWIKPRECHHWRCHWIADNDRTFVKKESRKPLPVGDYVTTLYVKTTNGKTADYVRKFKVQ